MLGYEAPGVGEDEGTMGPELLHNGLIVSWSSVALMKLRFVQPGLLMPVVQLPRRVQPESI
jgi:hypothetical protein